MRGGVQEPESQSFMTKNIMNISNEELFKILSCDFNTVITLSYELNIISYCNLDNVIMLFRLSFNTSSVTFSVFFTYLFIILLYVLFLVRSWFCCKALRSPLGCCTELYE